MNTDTIARLTIAVDFGTSLLDITAAGKYDWVNPYITPERFSVEGTSKRTFRTKLFHFDCSISSDDAVAAMQRENFLPATHVHGLVFRATSPEEQCKYPIACLGSSAQVYGARNVVCLCRFDGGRNLDLSGQGGVWNVRCRFLGDQEAADA
jgi:hypothetical protein